MPGCSMLLAAALATSGGGGRPPAPGLQPVHTFPFSAPLETSPTQPQAWVAGGGGAVWVLDVGQRRVRVWRLVPAGQKEPWQQRAWALPPELELSAMERGFVGLAPFGEAGTWLISAPQHRFWRLVGDQWQGPWPLEDRVAFAAALSGEVLVVNTPHHPQHPFARLGVGGQVLGRFGARRKASLRGLEAVENTWLLAPQEKTGGLVAAHAFWPLVALWDGAGTLRAEERLTSRQGVQLGREQERRLRQPKPWGEEGCVTCELLQVTSGLATTASGEIWWQVAGSPLLERLDPQGRWQETVPIHGAVVAGAGLAGLGPWLVVLQPEGPVFWQVQRNTAVRWVRVLSPTEAPVAGARVELWVGGVLAEEGQTDAAGRVTFPAPPPRIPLRVVVRAAGFLLWHQDGLAETLLDREIHLQLARSLCARVVREGDERPVERFRMAVDWVGDGTRTSVEEGPAVSVESPDGRGCLSTWLGYPLQLRVQAPGFALFRQILREPPGEELVVRLQPGAELTVQVRDPRRRPVEGAWVRLLEAGLEARSAYALGSDRVGVTDAQGELALPGLPAGSYRLQVEAKGFLPWEDALELSPEVTVKTVILRVGAAVRVVVSERGSGTPVQGAWVHLRPGAGGTVPLPECVTDGVGSCLLSGVPAGGGTLEVRAEGFVPVFRSFQVEKGEEEVRVEVALARGVRLEGQVRGVDAYPEAQLLLRLTAPGTVGRDVPLDRTGTFSVADVPVGSVHLFVVDARTTGSLAQKILHITGEEPVVSVTLELPSPLELFGRVLEGENPAAGFRVRLTAISAEVRAPAVEALTDAGGGFHLRLPRPGSWQVTVVGPQGETVWTETLTLNASQERVFRLWGNSLSGEVVDAGGAPVEEAWVTVWGGATPQKLQETLTDRQGRFAFRRLPRGVARVTAQKGSALASHTVEMTGGAHPPVRLQLNHHGGTLVRLTASPLGEPITQRVTFGCLTPQGYFLVERGPEGPGLFRLPVAAQDVRALVVAVPGFALATAWGPAMAGGPWELVVPRQARSFSMEVAEGLANPCALGLTDGAGRPVALTVAYPPGPVPLSTRTGMFNFLPEGRFTLTLYPCRGEAISRVLVLAPGHIPHVVFP
ncbi:MAG: carboxypeptidase-like regulatory domain-containing protein [Thermoanaerobaculum sp.]|nr:carboxypeptidase-like regulatory domain-containing protein [Thermoanaerobaculum sp.]